MTATTALFALDFAYAGKHLVRPRLIPAMGSMRRRFYKLYSAMQSTLVPGLRNSQYAYKETLSSFVNRDTMWLDLGCGHQLLPEWMPSATEEQAAFVARCKAIVGIDYDTRGLQKHGTIRDKVRGDIQRLPFREDCIDLVTANMVAEHVQDAGKLLTEIHRVLRPGGIFLFHTPNLFSYATIIACLIPGFIKIKLIRFLQGRNEEDVFSTYYRFNTLGRATALARRTGFNISEFKFVESSAQTVMLGPIVILELLLIRLLRLNMLQNGRTNIIGVFQKATLR